MEIVSINPKRKDEVQAEEQKQSMLEVLAYMKNAVEAGEIKEFVACSLDDDGIAQIHVSAMDLPGSIGLFEIGKHLLISQESFED
jgi:hypothetical protein